MRTTALLLAALLLLPISGAVPAGAQDDEVPNVLVWTGTYGFRHPSITAAQLALLQLAQTGAFDVTITENPADLTAARLRDVDVLMFVSTTGKPPLSDEQQAAIVRFAGCGGGMIGFHAALDSNYGWPEHAEIFGAQFDSHPQNAGAGSPNMQVEDREHPITEGWHDVESFPFDDEYYRWRTAKDVPGVSLPRNLPGVNVLLSLDETSVAEGIQDGPIAYEDDQPIAWTKTFRDGGRVYYNNMGHSDGTWRLPEFLTALTNGVGWVAEVPLDVDCFDGDAPLPPAPAPPAADPSLLAEPCTVPELSDRTGGTWETSGPARALTVEGDSVAVAGGAPGGLSWGAQTWILDLSGTSSPTADVTFTVEIPNPADDYDLSVNTAWGWYGSDQRAGVASETVTIEDVPTCAYLHVAADNMFAGGRAAPTLTAAVVPGPEVQAPMPPTNLATRLTASSAAPGDLAAAWTALVEPSTCTCALLARNDDFADALASGFAQSFGAPLLLTASDQLSPTTSAELERLGITRVTLLGGPVAISEEVVAELEARNITTDRVFGETRIETAVAIAASTGSGTTPPTTDQTSDTDQATESPETTDDASTRQAAPATAPLLLRAYGQGSAGFADSLAAGREAARAGRPVLLTASDSLSHAVADHLTSRGIREVVVVGGPAAVSEQVIADLQAIDVTAVRVDGPTRIETALEVARQLAGAADGAAADGVILLDGAADSGWAEGFVAAGSGQPGPIVLADGDTLPQATIDWLGTVEDGSVPLTCGALVAPAACDAAAAALGLE